MQPRINENYRKSNIHEPITYGSFFFFEKMLNYTQAFGLEFHYTVVHVEGRLLLELILRLSNERKLKNASLSSATQNPPKKKRLRTSPIRKARRRKSLGNFVS